MKRIFLGLIATIVTVSMLFSFVGCTKETPAEYFDYYYDPNREGIVITGFNNKADLHSVVIPKRINKHPVTCIGKEAFCSEYFKSITIPNTVIEIGNDAFAGCKSLNDVIIPNGVTEIRACTFSNCMRLSTVTIPDSVKKIGSLAFSGCISLTNVTIPDSVEYIDPTAFERTGVKLPERFN